jgi:uncharacterized protein
MRKLFAVSKFGFPLSTLVLLMAAVCAYSQDNGAFSLDRSPLPPPTGFVNDYAGVIDSATKQQIENKIAELKQSTNPPVELAVAVVKTTGDRDIFDYSLAVARGWKIGSSQDDNPSALLFVAIDDRKYFTQVSRDLEDELPDSLAGSIQRQYLVPEFKKGNYGKGIADTVDVYINTIRSRSGGNAPPVAGTDEPAGSPGLSAPVFNFVCCLVILLVLLVMIFSRGRGKNKNDRGRWGGGGGFGGGGSALPWIIGSILTSGGGGSSSGSSDWGGGGGSSGGWGGFGGGGDFGGGGAGGGW